ncbi:MAG TPA: arylesterase [Chthoniobacterales bacterium]|jgi:acyl-CoA thioesterase-1
MNKKAFRAVENRLMHTLAAFLFLGLTTASAFATATPAESASARVRIPNVLVLGDSISAGYGLRRTDAYPALLSEKAASTGKRLHVINAGVSGDTTAGGLRRLGRLLDRRVDILLIELGINDAFRGVPVVQIESNLQAIIDRTRARYPEATVLIAGLQMPGYSRGDYLTDFGAMYVELARRNAAHLVPFFLEGVIGNPALNLPDMIHPNAGGQKVLAANIWPVLESALNRKS